MELEVVQGNELSPGRSGGPDPPSSHQKYASNASLAVSKGKDHSPRDQAAPGSTCSGGLVVCGGKGIIPQAELSEGMDSKHREMPQTDFSDEEADAILPYLYAFAIRK